MSSDLLTNLAYIALLILANYGVYRSVKKFGRLEARFNPAIFFTIQVALFIAAHDGAYEIVRKFHTLSKGDIGWGIAVYVNVWIFIILSFFSSLIVSFLSKEKGFIVLIAAYLVFCCLPIQSIQDRPYRVSLLILCAFVSFIAPFFIQNLIVERKNRPTFE